MRTQRFGDLDVRLVGGTDREGGGDGPLVVLLHGFGAPGSDLVPLWRELAVPREVRFAFPAAPLELDFGASLGAFGMEPPRAWWMIDIERLEATLARGELRDLTQDVPEGLGRARELIVGTLDALESELGVPGSRVVLGGFSQGAMLALDVALRTERPLAGLVLLSGTLLAEHEWRPLMPRRAGLGVLQSHGRADPLLPFPIAEMLHRALVEAGLAASFLPFNGGHEISGSVLDALGPFLTKALPTTDG